MSLDTSKPEVMQRALDMGLDIVNDVNALRAAGAAAAVVAHGSCGVCLMHMQGEPRSMQSAPAYVDVLADVRGFLADRASELGSCGVGPDRIVIDPGYGFGKTVEHNFELLRRQAELLPLGFVLFVAGAHLHPFV